MPSVPHDEIEVEVLEENLVKETRLCASVRVVLLADRIHVDAKDSAEASNCATSAVLAFVAMHEDRVVGAVHDEAQSSLHFARVYTHFALVGTNVDMEVLDTSFLHEVLICWRERLRYECEDRLDFDVLQEIVILLLGIAAPVDASGQHSAVVGGRDERM